MHDAIARTYAIRLEADRLQTMDGHGRFSRRRAAGLTTGEGLVQGAVERARDGDEDALRLLYLRYSNTVFSQVCSIVRDEHAAEDITQTVFTRLPLRLRNYESRVVSFGAWIARVAHNASIDYLRAQRTVPCEEVLDPQASREDVSADRLAAIREALAALPEDQREILTLRFVLGLSPKEVAERLGRSERAIHALQHRGRTLLRRELTRLQATPATLGATTP
jgi:RNA polymerase sigma-70 factor (ECF subfamily)